jgi:hypothetical protein
MDNAAPLLFHELVARFASMPIHRVAAGSRDFLQCNQFTASGLPLKGSSDATNRKENCL